ncbi:MAG: undecaprenyl-phosphate glucose phosphotransferase [Chlamydiae bacterium]|nr:undecaprenyl-phosphate glucose phosphotransferase [Chlamydiota bacterium]MBI3266079.1 undecaprenyl-phosphate glucose phosphotransferase [Chlamydiota bacterium]
MPKAKQRMIDFWMTVASFLTDALVLYLTFCLAFWVRFHSGLLQVTRGIPAFLSYQANFPVAILVMLWIFKARGLYVRRKLGSGIRPFQMIKSVTFGMFVLMSLTFVYRDVSYSRLLVVVAWLLCVVSVLLGRKCLGELQKFLYKRFGIKKRVLVIGVNDLSGKIVRGLEKARDFYEIIGVLAESAKVSFLDSKIPLLGTLDVLSEVLAKERIDEVVLAVPELEQKKVVEVILACEREMIYFRMIPNVFEILTSQVEIENFYGVTLLGLKPFPLEKATNRFLKKSMDVLGAGLGFVLISPFFLFLAILVKRSSRGPVFYKQERVGEDGRTFTMIKFRTMHENAEEKTGPVWTSREDPRRTKIGKFLRKYNLDELPQLWNVLKGEMSLVGPRPERPHFVNEFKDRVPRYMSRHKIKSGMTGWAQVNGLRGNTSISERIKYDLYYLENWSILLDLKIIFRTLFARENAY